MADDKQRRAPPRPGGLPAEKPAAPKEGATGIFTLKVESWLTDLNQPPPADGLVYYADDPPAQPPMAPSPAVPVPPPAPTPLPVSSPFGLDGGRPPAPAAASAVPRIPAPAASAVPPIPALAASAVPPIPALAGGGEPAERPRAAGPIVLLALAIVVLLAAGGGAWFLWGESIRALLKI